MRLAALLSFFMLLDACGYVGPVLPPSPEIPATITDLSVSERGDKIIAVFTAPARTTDGVAITRFSSIELRLGTKTYNIDPPASGDRDDPQPKLIAYTIPVSDFTGQSLSVSVRTAIKRSGHFSAWSNTWILDIVPPLSKPTVQAEGSANGIVLNWVASDDAQYQIQRQGPNDKQPIEVAVVNENHYTDISAQYDTSYHYTVTARKGSAESLASEPVEISAQDKYPPAAPTGLTALAGPDEVDLAWQRNTESDFQGYYIYRSTNNGPFERQGQLTALPTYTDRNVEHGKTYSYKISAIDKKANESAQSASTDAQY